MYGDGRLCGFLFYLYLNYSFVKETRKSEENDGNPCISFNTKPTCFAFLATVFTIFTNTLIYFETKY